MSNNNNNNNNSSNTTKENDGRSSFQRRQRLLTLVALSSLFMVGGGVLFVAFSSQPQEDSKKADNLVSMNRLRRLVHTEKDNGIAKNNNNNNNDQKKKKQSREVGGGGGGGGHQTVPTTVAAAAVSKTKTTLKDDDDSSITVEFTVANLDGMANSKEGTFVVQTRPHWAPLGAQRFAELSRAHFWNDCFFFRVIDHFIAQFGISGSPQIQQEWRSKSAIPDDPVMESNQRGTVTFATSGKNTRTTQLFINTGRRNGFLDKQGFSPFAQVIRGMDVVDRLYSGYGEGKPQGHGPNQGKIQQQGNVYLRQEFPRLSYIVRAVIVDNNDTEEEEEEEEDEEKET